MSDNIRIDIGEEASLFHQRLLCFVDNLFEKAAAAFKLGLDNQAREFSKLAKGLSDAANGLYSCYKKEFSSHTSDVIKGSDNMWNAIFAVAENIGKENIKEENNATEDHID